jgi:acyl-CoA reductase-like NAD-dependent aldehyde dehydrogenase
MDEIYLPQYHQLKACASEVVKSENRCPIGLQYTIFEAREILAGRVTINGMLDDQQAPFGGFKHSGVGREFGTFGIEAFLEPRAILE